MPPPPRSAVHPDRVTPLNARPARPGPVLYWMSRDQRADDNWAMLHAQALALRTRAPLAVVFCLARQFLGASARHYEFMLKGLAETEAALARKGIRFFLLPGDPPREIAGLAARVSAGAVVTDFDPLRIKRGWSAEAARRLDAPLLEVDAHNIVPCRAASPKREYAAYTIRPRIRRLLPEFLGDLPALRRHPHAWPGPAPAADWRGAREFVKPDPGVPEVAWLVPGARAARRRLRSFIEAGLASYDTARNDPTADGQSDLSPYLHFGQIAPQRVALEVQRADVPEASKAAFLEELIVRRELSDNYCLHTESYDTLAAAPAWARRSLEDHALDPRPHVYRLERFEAADTHDALWNAAQLELVTRGKMHGYLRMYWAKKILEWSRSPEEAMSIAVALNDRYELDGRDPNGYAGVAWSIAGVHDRAWFDRPVFGKIRYMSLGGCRSKFSVDRYVRRVSGRA